MPSRIRLPYTVRKLANPWFWRVFWLCRFPIAFLACLGMIGPLMLTCVPQILGNGLLLSNWAQMAAVTSLSMVLATLLMVQIDVIQTHGVHRFDDLTGLAGFFLFNRLIATTKPRIWNWAFLRTVIWIACGLSFPVSCWMHTVSQADEFFFDEPSLTLEGGLIGLTTGFVVYFAIMQLVASIISLFVSAETSAPPFLPLAFIVRLNLGSENGFIAHRLRHFIPGFHWMTSSFRSITQRQQFAHWQGHISLGASFVLLTLFYVILYCSTEGHEITPEDTFSTPFFVLLLMSICSLMLSSLAYFLDGYRFPSLLFCLLLLCVLNRISGFDHRFSVLRSVDNTSQDAEFVDDTRSDFDPQQTPPATDNSNENSRATDKADETVAAESAKTIVRLNRSLRLDAILPPVTREIPNRVIGKRTKSEDQPIRPPLETMLVVLAPGGGIHAAAWTGRVLSGLHERYREKFEDSLMLISAVSGGAVGAMFYLDNFPTLKVANHGLQLDQLKNMSAAKFDSTVEQVFRRSSASSLEAVAWGATFPDFSRFVFGRFISEDRGAVQERRWLRRMDVDEGWGPTLRDWQAAASRNELPFVAFNATEAETGRRLLFSTIEMPPDMTLPDAARPIDFFTVAKEQFDIPISTAVRLSATFAYASPAAMPARNTLPFGHVVDGGYVDNEGLITAVEFIRRWLRHPVQADKWKDLKRIIIVRICHEPPLQTTVVSTTDQGLEGAGWEYAAMGPLVAMGNVRVTSQRERGEIELKLLNNAKSARSIEGESLEISFATIQFQRMPGYDAPPLNWKLSSRQRSTYRKAWRNLTHAANEAYKANPHNSRATGLEKLDQKMNWKPE